MVAVQIVKRMRPVIRDPVAELALRHRALQFCDRLAESQRQGVPKPRLTPLGYAFPDALPLISSTTAKMAFSAPVLSVSAFS